MRVERLAFQPPLAAETLFGFLARRALPGLEQLAGDRYHRVLEIDGAVGVVSARIAAERCEVELELDDALAPHADVIVAGARRVFDVDADPVAIDTLLADDPRLRPLVERRPGVRVSGAFDGFEIAVRAVLGQQISVAAARTIASRLSLRLGSPLPEPRGTLAAAFPRPESIAAQAADSFGIPAARGATLVALGQSVADGQLDLSLAADPEAGRTGLLALPGIGPWTASYVAMRAFADRDAFLAGDLVLRQMLGDDGPASAAEIERRSTRWRPWRAYAVAHLWAEASDRKGAGAST